MSIDSFGGIGGFGAAGLGRRGLGEVLGDDERRGVDKGRTHREQPTEHEQGSGHHLAVARPKPVGWARATDGTWIASGVDGELWEVFCADCGDLDGPVEQQSPAVQQLRGPYRHERHARRIAKKHARLA